MPFWHMETLFSIQRLLFISTACVRGFHRLVVAEVKLPAIHFSTSAPCVIISFSLRPLLWPCSSQDMPKVLSS